MLGQQADWVMALGEWEEYWQWNEIGFHQPQVHKYAALIISLMAKDCRYLLETLLYNPDLYDGPPFFVPDEQLHSLFGSSCDIELLQSVDAMTDLQRQWWLDKCTQNAYLITPKSS